MFEKKEIRDLSDEYIFEKIKEGFDEVYFSELVSRYYAVSLTMARTRLFNKAYAEDVVQEAFIKVLRKCNTHKSGILFAPWFYTILKNTCADFARSEICRKNFESKFLEESEVQNSDIEFSFEEIIRCLSEDEQEILTCRYIHDLTFPEIALKLGVHIETLKKRTQRALKKLKNKMFLIS